MPLYMLLRMPLWMLSYMLFVHPFVHAVVLAYLLLWCPTLPCIESGGCSTARLSRSVLRATPGAQGSRRSATASSVPTIHSLGSAHSARPTRIGPLRSMPESLPSSIPNLVSGWPSQYPIGAQDSPPVIASSAQGPVGAKTY